METGWESGPAPLAELHGVFAALSDRAALASRDELAQLHTVVCAAVRELKAHGEPPEAVIVTIRRIAMEAGLEAGDRLLSRVVTWCLDEYFS